MANISDATGTFTFVGNWNRRQRETFMLMVYAHSAFDYCIYLADEMDVINVPEVGDEISFSASGRWTFTNNLERFYDWSQIPIDGWMRIMNSNADLPYIGYNTYRRRCRQLLRDMRAQDLAVTWNFADVEPGCNVLYKADGSHKVNKNLQLQYNEDNSTSYECNARNASMLTDDTADLESAVDALAHLYRVHAYSEEIEAIIKAEPNWYGIGIWPSFDNYDEVPEELRKVLDARFGREYT